MTWPGVACIKHKPEPRTLARASPRALEASTVTCLTTCAATLPKRTAVWSAPPAASPPTPQTREVHKPTSCGRRQQQTPQTHARQVGHAPATDAPRRGERCGGNRRRGLNGEDERPVQAQSRSSGGGGPLPPAPTHLPHVNQDSAVGPTARPTAHPPDHPTIRPATAHLFDWGSTIVGVCRTTRGRGGKRPAS